MSLSNDICWMDPIVRNHLKMYEYMINISPHIGSYPDQCNVVGDEFLNDEVDDDDFSFAGSKETLNPIVQHSLMFDADLNEFDDDDGSDIKGFALSNRYSSVAASTDIDDPVADQAVFRV